MVSLGAGSSVVSRGREGDQSLVLCVCGRMPKWERSSQKHLFKVGKSRETFSKGHYAELSLFLEVDVGQNSKLLMKKIDVYRLGVMDLEAQSIRNPCRLRSIIRRGTDYSLGDTDH
ncbi:hypothetical protein Tco_1484737 [Tanacetum coccineum]